MTSTLPHIALTGKLRAGKSELAAYLSLLYRYEQFAFGDALKLDFHRRYPEIPPDPKPRVGYQMHGQLMRRLIGENVWIDACFDEIRRQEAHHAAIKAPPMRACITDLRQPNEFAAVKAAGYVVIRINCPDAIRLERAQAAGDAFKAEDLSHETEQHVDTFAADYDVDNSGTKADLRAQVDAIMRDLRGQRP